MKNALATILLVQQISCTSRLEDRASEESKSQGAPDVQLAQNSDRNVSHRCYPTVVCRNQMESNTVQITVAAKSTILHELVQEFAFSNCDPCGFSDTGSPSTGVAGTQSICRRSETCSSRTAFSFTTRVYSFCRRTSLTVLCRSMCFSSSSSTRVSFAVVMSAPSALFKVYCLINCCRVAVCNSILSDRDIPI